MTETTKKEIRKTIVIDASPDVVFRALIDEKELTQWFPNQEAMLEARVGGAWVFKNHRPDTGENHTMRGTILEIIPEKSCYIHGRSTSIQTSQRQSSRGRWNQ